LLVPRYDQVLLAPLCTALVACTLPLVLWAAGIDGMASACASIAVVLALAILLPPTKYRWKLTGAHQMARLGSRAPRSRRVGEKESDDLI
jgi:hypothetical protein